MAYRRATIDGNQTGQGMESAKMVDRKVRATLLESPDASAAVDAKPTGWGSDYLIQLAQNITTGAGFGTAIAIVWHWISDGNLPSNWWIPCASAGALWAIFWTLLRFHGDEIGLFRIAYKAGAASRDAQVNALMLELQSLRGVIDAGQAGPATSTSERRIAIANATLKNARALLNVVYSGDSISRAAMAQRGMGQADWERAMRLCKLAGVLDEQGQRRVRDLADALKLIAKVHSDGVNHLQSGKRTGVPWG